MFQRQGEPWQLAPRPEAPFFDQGLAKQFTDYDPDLANTLLDRIGLTEKDGNGFRLRPDGDRLRFDLDVPVGSLNPAWLPGAEMVKEYWSEVGIDVGINAQDRSLFWDRMTSAQHDATVWDGQHGMRDAPLIPITYLPAAGHSQFAPLWGQWYVSGGETGEEPPAGVREQLELFDRVKSELDDERRYELFAEVLAISREQFYSIGIALPPNEYGIVRTSFANVPKVMPGAWAYPTPAPTRPEQYFTSADTR